MHLPGSICSYFDEAAPRSTSPIFFSICRQDRDRNPLSEQSFLFLNSGSILNYPRKPDSADQIVNLQRPVVPARGGAMLSPCFISIFKGQKGLEELHRPTARRKLSRFRFRRFERRSRQARRVFNPRFLIAAPTRRRLLSLRRNDPANRLVPGYSRLFYLLAPCSICDRVSRIRRMENNDNGR